MASSFNKDQKNWILDSIKEYFYNERSEEIGDLAAENFFEFISNEIGPIFYNQGVHDAKEVVEQKVMNLDEDLLALEKQWMRKR